jgi:hypothetical protein
MLTGGRHCRLVQQSHSILEELLIIAVFDSGTLSEIYINERPRKA